MLSGTLSAVNYIKYVIFLTFLSCLLFYNLVFYLGFLKMPQGLTAYVYLFISNLF